MVTRRISFSDRFSYLNIWAIILLLVAIVFLGPIFAVFFAAAGDSGGLWKHLFETVLPRYVWNTLSLMFGVSVVSFFFGVTSAWTVVRYDFKGRFLFQWLLLLPAAVPAYLIAYTYTDFLEYAGPVQKILREIFGWQMVHDYWFPEIRSMGGAMLVMGSVLYPYVYVMARTAFLQTPKSIFEVGLLARRSLFWCIGLPLARPAIAAGLALVLMETISDFGTVEYFAIETLTLGIFNVWLGMNSLTAAAQIASFSFLFIILLLVIELMARSFKRYNDTSKGSISLPPEIASSKRTIACWLICGAPVLIGFVVPICVLSSFVVRGYSLELTEEVVQAATNSIVLSLCVSALVMLVAVYFGLVSVYKGGVRLRQITTLASIGYAFPGTILAIGVVTAGGLMDNLISSALLNTFGATYEGWLTSGIGLVVVACVIRFQAVGYGAVTTGLKRLPANMMNANLLLGKSFGHGMQHVIIPLIRLSVVAGGLLVFVDVMKELPMTLLLRPFNFETLPTYVYQFAKDELLEEAALPALFIIATGLIPVFLMNVVINNFSRKQL